MGEEPAKNLASGAASAHHSGSQWFALRSWREKPDSPLGNLVDEADSSAEAFSRLDLLVDEGEDILSNGRRAVLLINNNEGARHCRR